jgi:hypothetical protein
MLNSLCGKQIDSALHTRANQIGLNHLTGMSKGAVQSHLLSSNFLPNNFVR